MEVPAITIEPSPQKPTPPKSKSPTKVSPAVSNDFPSAPKGTSTNQTPSTSMEKATAAPNVGVATSGAGTGTSPAKGTVEYEKKIVPVKPSTEPANNAQNGISFASSNNFKNNIFVKLDSENNNAAAPKPSPVKHNRPLPAQPKPSLSKLAPPTLRPKADDDNNV